MGQKNRGLRNVNGQVMYPDAIVDSFLGVFELDTVTGRQWNDFVQSGVLNLSAGNEAVRGGEEYVKITADGTGINIPVGWVNLGSDAIDPSAGKINRIC